MLEFLTHSHVLLIATRFQFAYEVEMVSKPPLMQNMWPQIPSRLKDLGGDEDDQLDAWRLAGLKETSGHCCAVSLRTENPYYTLLIDDLCLHRRKTRKEICQKSKNQESAKEREANDPNVALETLSEACLGVFERRPIRCALLGPGPEYVKQPLALVSKGTRKDEKIMV